MKTATDSRASLWQARAERSVGSHAEFKTLYTLAWYRRLEAEARAQRGRAARQARAPRFRSEP
jgi:hypothetical protein